jgi:dihydrodipicolinate synthase/N-acetylneuraminate lyase
MTGSSGKLTAGGEPPLDLLCRDLIGIVPSLNTPFLADGNVDLPAVVRLVDASVSAGVAGLLVTAVAAENRALQVHERRAIGEAIVAANAGRIPVIAAVSAPDIAMAVTLTDAAVKSGIGSVCYQAPGGITRETLGDHLARIADRGASLVMLQDLDWTGPGLALADIEWLYARQSAFRAIKVEANPAGPKYTALLEAFGGALHVSGGWAVQQMIEALERGVHAFMPTALDHVYVAIHRRFARGDAAGARVLFEELLPFVAFSNQHIDVSIRFFKRLRLLQGIFATDLCREPTLTLDRYQSASLDLLAVRAIALDARVAKDAASAPGRLAA